MRKLLTGILLISIITISTSCSSGNSPNTDPLTSIDVATPPIWEDVSGNVSLSYLEDCGIDLREIVLRYYDELDVKSVSFYIYETNFSHSSVNNQTDKTLQISINTGGYLGKENIICCYIYDKDNSSYINVFEQRLLMHTYRELDLTGDYQNEIILTRAHEGNGYTNYLWIFRYDTTLKQFVCVFHEGLSELYGDDNFYYQNTYQFIKSKDNQNIFDVVFDCILYGGGSSPETAVELESGKIIFKMHNGVYEKSRSAIDYRKGFSEKIFNSDVGKTKSELGLYW